MHAQFKFKSETYSGLDKLGRIPLSRSFHMREFLYSEIAIHYGIRNVPDNVDLAVASGRNLCQLLLEPLQDAFGRVHVRSGYRSRNVNTAGVSKHNCAKDNDGFHTWDHPRSHGLGYGAVACISIPSLSRLVFTREIDYQNIAWWIFDNLPDWSVMEFFATPSDITFADEVTFNIGWHETPLKSVTTWRGGKANLGDKVPDEISRRQLWSGLPELVRSMSSVRA
jgi:hypothetical protein